VASALEELTARIDEAGVRRFDITLLAFDGVTMQAAAHDILRMLDAPTLNLVGRAAIASWLNESSTNMVWNEDFGRSPFSPWTEKHLSLLDRSVPGSSVDHFPRSITPLLDLVVKTQGIQVDIGEVVGSSDFLASLLTVNADGRAQIKISAALSKDWKRFVVVKEMTHLLLDLPSMTLTNLLQIMEYKLGSDPVDTDGDGHSALDALLALEFLYPSDLRNSAKEALQSGLLSTSDLSRQFGLPEQLILAANALPRVTVSDDTAEYIGIRSSSEAFISLAARDFRTSTASNIDAVAREKRWLEQTGGILSLSEAANLLKIDFGSLWSKISSGRIFAINVAGEWQLPKAQFDTTHGEVRSGVVELLEPFSARPSHLILQFLATRDTVLDGLTPLDALKRGGVWRDAAIRLAHAQQGDGFA
jgi:hypothetical protein